jgi:uncharacterized membrane protein YuzA (DUF378 family)
MLHNSVKLNMLARLILVVGGLNYLLLGFGVRGVFSAVSPKALNAIAIVIGLATLYTAVNRDFFLPFLGPTVLGPVPSTRPLDIADASVVQVNIEGIPPLAKVVYFAANGSTSVFETPEKAYGDYSNGGLTSANNQGVAMVLVKKPGAYKVKSLGRERIIAPHVHYRYEIPGSPGMYSSIMTKKIQ